MKEVPSECPVICDKKEISFRDIAAGYGHTAALTTEGKIITWGLNKHGQLGTGDILTSYVPQMISIDIIGKFIYAKDNSTACVTQDGCLYTWGAGSNYRLMHGDCRTILAPKKVEALSHEKVTEFVFSTAASAVIIKTQLYNVSIDLFVLNVVRAVHNKLYISI